MASYQSNEELFADVRELIASFEQSGRGEAATELGNGLRALNGLTDGWAIFLDSIEAVRATAAGHLTDSEQRILNRIRDSVRALVYRA